MRYDSDHFLRKIATNQVSREEHYTFKNWLLNLPPEQQRQVLDRVEWFHLEVTQNQLFKSLPLPVINDTKRVKRKKYYGIAATVSLVLLSAITVLFILKPPHEVEYYTSSERKIMELDDGTQVELMPKSSLKVFFTKGHRRIELEGGALFKVFRDENRPMSVITEDVTTTVLGTTFHIKQLTKGLLINLIEGSISVNHQGEEEKIAPNQQWYLDRSTGKSFTFDARDPDFKEVRFENEPLEKIIAYLEMRFNLDSSYSLSQLKNCKISITIGNTPLSTSLELIEFATALTLKRNGNVLEVFGKCN